MLLLIVFLQISLINCDISITEAASKIKYALSNYKSCRHKRCANTKLENFLSKTLNVLEKTERFGEYLRHYNVSECLHSGSEYSISYVDGHILDGLLVEDDLPDTHWYEYKAVYNKQYPSHHHEREALSEWRENLRRVAKHNRHYLAGIHSYSLHLNHFGDLGANDYFKRILKLIETVPLFDPAEDHHKTAYRSNLHRRVPRKVDWRAKGYRPRREEQWQCGACYAFAVTHAVQAQLYKRHSNWRELSPQQIVDCSYKDGNTGCNGGSLRAALRYAAREGLVFEKYYPYIGKISLINCDISITEAASKIKYALSNYKSCRHKRCANTKLENFLSKTLNVLEKTERFGEYLRHYNVSECLHSGSEYSISYVDGHILDGLLVEDDLPDTHWYEYKAVYNKQYPSHHHEREALSEWRENLRRVAKHNRHYLAGIHSYSLHLNHFGDLGANDYFKRILKLIETVPLFDPAEDHHKTAYRSNLHRRVPRKVDWRAKGYRPRREEQWQCGACYAFAVTHAVQAQLYKRHSNWRELSPQQIVDCSYKDGNTGCNGGSLRAALRYAAREGLVFEKYYPYIGKKSFCHPTSLLLRVKPRRWATIPAGDERAMERALANIGPLAVAVNAAPVTFQLYRSGIYDDPFCTPWQLNHAMLLVGYTPQYWILLNWWGRNWGEDGYIRIRRGFNRCGVANMATYVEL